MERARDAIAEAEAMAQLGHWNACVSRLYYACFYAVIAVLLHRGLTSSKHSGARSLFGRYLVRPGAVPRELARVYNELFDSRQEADYRDLVRFGEAQVRPWIADVGRFVEHVGGLIEPGAKMAPDG
jgi:uncharacterized protein (UPF0332 family)